jgi:hypothetical protein
MLNCLNLSRPPYGLAFYVGFLLLSMSCAHTCLFSCIYTTRIPAQTGRTLKTTPVISIGVRVFSQLPVEALYPLRELVIYVPFKTLVL